MKAKTLNWSTARISSPAKTLLNRRFLGVGVVVGGGRATTKAVLYTVSLVLFAYGTITIVTF